MLSSIKAPEWSAPALMAIDASDTIYLNRGRAVAAFSVNGAEQKFTVPPDMTDDWLLGKDYDVVNMNKKRADGYSNCSFGNRRLVKPGEFLFQEIKCDNNRTQPLQFNSASKIYNLSAFWKDKVSVSDDQNRFLYKVQLTPVYLKVFAFPMPFLVVLLILAALAWLLNRLTRSAVSVIADPAVHRVNVILQALFGLVSLGVVAFESINLISGLRGDWRLLPYALVIMLLMILLLHVKNLLSVWAHLTLQFLLISFVIYPLTYIPSIKGWDAFAAAVPWPVRLATYIIPAGVLVVMASKISELAFRVRCPEEGCNGWCKRQDLYPATFICHTCGKKYATSIYITGGR